MNETSTIVKKLVPGTKTVINIKDALGSVCCCFVEVTRDNVAGVAITDDKYPDEAAFMAVSNMLMDFRHEFDKKSHEYMEATESTKIEYKKIEVFLTEWQNPLKVDPKI